MTPLWTWKETVDEYGQKERVKDFTMPQVFESLVLSFMQISKRLSGTSYTDCYQMSHAERNTIIARFQEEDAEIERIKKENGL
jgi:hypothetical protein